MAMNEERPISVGVIGLGGMGSYHARCYEKLPAAKLVAVADLDPSKLEAFESSSSPRRYKSADALLRSPEIEAVDICTPTHTHAELSIKAARAGKHILCEKPLARTLEEGRKIIESVREAGVTMMVAFVLRFMRPYRKIHEIITNGELGRIGVVRTSRCGALPEIAWYRNFETSGGTALDLVIHDIDFLIWSLGPVERVYAKSLLLARREPVDYALITLRFKNGAIAHIEGSWAETSGFYWAIEAAGSQGLVNYDSRESLTLRMASRKDKTPQDEVSLSCPSRTEPVLEEIGHFIKCIKENEAPPVGPEEALQSLKVSLAAIKSAETGKPISPDDTATEGEG